MDYWPIAIKFLLNHEGGLSNNPRDHGGITNFGISLRYLKSMDIDIDGDGDSDEEDIRAIDKESASNIYKRYWWDKFHYYKINDGHIACKILDMSVNMGSARAHKLIQEGLNNFDNNLKIDGILGALSYQAIGKIINDGHANDFVNELRDLSARYYINLVRRIPELKFFLNGWLRRSAA